MVFVAYADVGAGMAFLVLLALSCLGLAVIVVRALLRPAILRTPVLYIAAIGLLQAWVVYLWALRALADSRRTVECIWLGSLCVVLLAIVASVVAGRQTRAA